MTVKKTRAARDGSPLHTRFRTALEDVLACLPRQTPGGVVIDDIRPIQFGSRAGLNPPTKCWIYQPARSDLELCFGFYKNFTANDLICKVYERHDPPKRGVGASIQFNGAKSVFPYGTSSLELRHSGSVTVGSAISRADLCSLAQSAAPQETAALSLAPDTWPFRIGVTSHGDALLDRLFEYALVIEQAKRAKRGEAALPMRFAAEDEAALAPIKLRCIENDPLIRAAIEMRAMDVAEAHFRALGYEVDDRHAHESYDLLCTKGRERVFVEVKGTRGDGAVVLVTRNEVAHALAHLPHVALVVVSGIEVVADTKPVVARDGNVTVYWPWDPEQHLLNPIAFRCDLNAELHRA